MELPSKIRFADKNIEAAFNQLKEGKNDERELYERLVTAFEDIEKTARCCFFIFSVIGIPEKAVYIANSDHCEPVPYQAH